MIISRITKLALDVVRTEIQFTYKCSYAILNSAKIFIRCISNRSIKNYSTAITTDNKLKNKEKSWRPWSWGIPLGISISFLTVLQWRYFKNRHEINKGPLEGLMLECYCSLPLRITSRIWGGLANLQLPVYFRSPVYSVYSKMFKANLDEIDASLTEFSSLAEFFVRPLKPNVRVVAPDAEIVFPSDGKILHYGPVTSCKVEQVKGMTYNLQNFLGEPGWNESNSKNSISTNKTDAYISTLLKNPNNMLYQITIYLAPGDYHRFHSPADWKINLRRHFQGKLLSVNPRVAGWLPNLFSINERVVYIGEWLGGFMAYAAVGATNVGSIRVYKDQELVTNMKKWPSGKNSEDLSFDNLPIEKGELFGEFRMGSTIVLLFEAPKDFNFTMEVGQQVKYGQALSKCKFKKQR